MLVFLDTEFTDLLDPQLLSLGMVTSDGREHYVELDLKSEVGQARVNASSDFVRYGGLLDMWGKVPGAAGTEWELGRSAGEWLRRLAAESNEMVEVAFDYVVDYELLEYLIRDAGVWDQVRERISPLNIDLLTGTIDGQLAAEHAYRMLSKRGIGRHHALADALALRAGYMSVKDVALRLSRLTHDGKLTQLLAGTPLTESWLRGWLLQAVPALGGRRPLDLLDEPGGFDRVAHTIQCIYHSVYL
jgi:hypothetical protein